MINEHTITGSVVSLLLLDKDDLLNWRDNKTEEERRLGKEIDAEEIKDRLLFAFNKKIENMINDPGSEIWYSYYAIEYKNKIIGCIGPKGKPTEKDKIIEIGYGISEKYWNKGIMTESIKLFCDKYFTEEGIDRIIAETEKGNTTSQKVLHKNGFKKIKEEGEMMLWELKKGLEQ